jgi:hypothetical protein
MKLRLQMTHLSSQTTRMIKKKKVEEEDEKEDEEEERDLLSRKANSKTKTDFGEEETPQPLSCNSLELTMLLQSRSEFQNELLLLLFFFFFFFHFLGQKKP